MPPEPTVGGDIVLCLFTLAIVAAAIIALVGRDVSAGR